MFQLFYKFTVKIITHCIALFPTQFHILLARDSIILGQAVWIDDCRIGCLYARGTKYNRVLIIIWLNRYNTLILRVSAWSLLAALSLYSSLFAAKVQTWLHFEISFTPMSPGPFSCVSSYRCLPLLSACLCSGVKTHDWPWFSSFFI